MKNEKEKNKKKQTKLSYNKTNQVFIPDLGHCNHTMELEKSRVSSQVRVFKTQTRNPTRKTRLETRLGKLDFFEFFKLNFFLISFFIMF
jgi:hypothetical protein